MLEICHAKQNPYNLVLLDWKMPEMDGSDVAKEIRKRYSNETTVIILTAYNWDEIMDEALHIGVDSFLAKPLFASNVISEFERIARKNNMLMLRHLRMHRFHVRRDQGGQGPAGSKGDEGEDPVDHAFLRGQHLLGSVGFVQHFLIGRLCRVIVQI